MHSDSDEAAAAAEKSKGTEDVGAKRKKSQKGKQSVVVGTKSKHRPIGPGPRPAALASDPRAGRPLARWF